MRILYLTGSLEAGGLERFVTRTALMAKEKGDFEPAVCCLRLRGGLFLSELEMAGIPVYQAPTGWERSPGAIIQLSKVFRQADADIIHSQVNYSLLQQLAAARLGGRATFAVTHRSLYQRERAAYWRQLIQFHILRLAGVHYSANSEEGSQYLAKQVMIKAETIPVLPNGIGTIETSMTCREKLRKQHYWQPDEVVIGCVARIAIVKRPLLFVQVIARLIEGGLPVKAVWVGDGPQRAAMETLISELGLEDVFTLTGIVTNVTEYLQAMDIFCLFSEREGMPNALLEAMAAGKPVVATPAGATPTLLDKGKAGILAESTDPDSLAQIVVELAGNPTKRAELGRLGQERALLFFGVEKSYGRLVQYYQGITRERNQQHHDS